MNQRHQYGIFRVQSQPLLKRGMNLNARRQTLVRSCLREVVFINTQKHKWKKKFRLLQMKDVPGTYLSINSFTEDKTTSCTFHVFEVRAFVSMEQKRSACLSVENNAKIEDTISNGRLFQSLLSELSRRLHGITKTPCYFRITFTLKSNLKCSLCK